MDNLLMIRKMLKVQNAQAIAREKLAVCGKLDEMIGTQIFDILEKESKGRIVVGMNASRPLEMQVWAAAHELFYLWFEDGGIAASEEDTDELGTGGEKEVLVNKFAAGFLVEEGLVFRVMRELGIGRFRLDVKDVIRLSEVFVVPYRVMVKRLYEVRACSLKEYERLMAYTDERVEIWRSRLGERVRG